MTAPPKNTVDPDELLAEARPTPEVVDAAGAPAADPPTPPGIDDDQWEEIIAVVRSEAETAVGEAWAARQPAVYAAMWAVMREVAWVGKSGRMTQGGTYAFRSIEDVQAALGLAFRTHGVMLSSTIPFPPVYDTREATKADGKVTITTTCRLVVEYRFTSLVDGSTVPITAAGEGRDVFDKSTSKAMTMALKYALTQATLLPTFDPDPDGQQVPGVPDDAPEVPRSPGPPAASPPNSGQPAGYVAPPAAPMAKHHTEGPEPTPGEVLTAIRGAGTVAELEEIAQWLSDPERDAMGVEHDGQTFGAHVEAARRALAGR